jgi:hypothetical protein
MKKFVTAFSVCLALFCALNAATYVLRSRSDGMDTYLRVGLPIAFWREGPSFSSFRPLALSVDVVFALWVSYRIGRWWEHRGTPDYLAGTKT